MQIYLRSIQPLLPSKLLYPFYPSNWGNPFCPFPRVLAYQYAVWNSVKRNSEIFKPHGHFVRFFFPLTFFHIKYYPNFLTFSSSSFLLLLFYVFFFFIFFFCKYSLLT